VAPKRKPDRPLKPSERRRIRVSPEEVRERMLQAALELTEELGALTVTLDLGMEDVIRRADVPRSAAYRLWPYRGDFIDDVIAKLASDDGLGLAIAEERSLGEAARELTDRANELASPEGRRALTLDLVRRFVRQNVHELGSAPGWNTYVALIAGANFMPEKRTAQRVAIELQRNDRAFLRRMQDYYEGVGKLLGLRPRASLTWRHFAIAAAAGLEGLVLRRSMIDPAKDVAREKLVDEDDWTLDEFINAPIMATPSGSDVAEEWYLPALTFLAVLDAFTEDDPDWSPDGLAALLGLEDRPAE
jgi:AcrR family transcriptional regulator